MNRTPARLTLLLLTLWMGLSTASPLSAQPAPAVDPMATPPAESTTPTTAGESLLALQAALAEARQLTAELQAGENLTRTRLAALESATAENTSAMNTLNGLVARMEQAERALRAQVDALKPAASPTAQAAIAADEPLPLFAITAAVLAALAFVAATASLVIGLKHSQVTRMAVSDVPDRLAHRLDPEKWVRPLRDAIDRLETAPPYPTPSTDAPSAATAPSEDLSGQWTRLHDRFDTLEHRLGALSRSATGSPFPAASPKKADAMAAATSGGTGTGTTASAESTLVEAIDTPETSEPVETVEAVHLDPARLPAAFSPTGRLGSWRKALEAHVAEELHSATSLVETLEKWREANNSRDEHRVLEVTHQLGQRFFLYLDATQGDDPSSWIDPIQEWTKSFRIALEEAFPRFKLVAVYPQDRFDTDRMEVARGSASGRLSVKKPRSWMIVEKTDSGERVLRRAEVITA
ncbi:MAG: hypothetical protein ACFB20_01800 [Opitutales bacterium]